MRKQLPLTDNIHPNAAGNAYRLFPLCWFLIVDFNGDEIIIWFLYKLPIKQAQNRIPIVGNHHLFPVPSTIEFRFSETNANQNAAGLKPKRSGIVYYFFWYHHA
jgi:hypothetical protein